MTGAKSIAAMIVLISFAQGCAGIARIAPPGLIRYENLAGDTPPNPEIQARIENRRGSEEARYPVLSDQPDARPEKAPKKERDEIEETLIAKRDQLAEEIDAARAKAAEERARGALLPGEKSKGPRPLDETRDALSDAVEKENDAARRERSAPLAPPPDPDGP